MFLESPAVDMAAHAMSQSDVSYQWSCLLTIDHESSHFIEMTRQEVRRSKVLVTVSHAILGLTGKQTTSKHRGIRVA